MSGYPPNYGYGAPPPSQPYSAPTSQPYSAAPTSQPYSAAPNSQPYAAAPYGAPQPGQQPYGGPSAPYASAPSAPPYAPAGEKPQKDHNKPYGSAPPPNPGYPAPPHGSGYPQSAPPHGSGYPQPGPQQHGGGYPSSAPPQHHGGGGYSPSSGAPYGSPFAALVPSAFPPGTDPNVVACFQIADQDGSGFIDDKELQRALSSYNQSFSMRTVHLLMYLFTNTNNRVIGPKEFTSVFYSLQSWRANFEKFDRDRSGKIDTSELREALLSLGFSVSPVVLDLLVSKFDKSGGKNRAIEYDNFIECCLTVKGLTEKFKEKDTAYSGSVTFTYETFMLTVLPFLIA